MSALSMAIKERNDREKLARVIEKRVKFYREQLESRGNYTLKEWAFEGDEMQQQRIFNNAVKNLKRAAAESPRKFAGKLQASKMGLVFVMIECK